jgi:hypothetical protein
VPSWTSRKPGLDHQGQQGTVAATEPGGLVGRGEQRGDLGVVEVADDAALVAFGRDRHDPRDGVRVLGVLECCVPVEGVDRAEAGVAGAGTVAAVAFEVGQEGADQWRVEVVDVQLERLLARLLVRESQQQPERVTVRGDRART